MEELIKKTISEVHFQHRLWINELTFYLEELKIFQHRMEELEKDLAKVSAKGLEKYKNAVEYNLSCVDQLLQSIEKNEKEAIESAKLHIRRVDYLVTSEHLQLGERMKEYQENYFFLRVELQNFLKGI